MKTHVYLVTLLSRAHDPERNICTPICINAPSELSARQWVGARNWRNNNILTVEDISLDLKRGYGITNMPSKYWYPPDALVEEQKILDDIAYETMSSPFQR